MAEKENKSPLDEVLEFIKCNKTVYENAITDKKVIDNYVSGNGFSTEAVKAYECAEHSKKRARAKVNAKFLSGYINQLKGLLIANKFDLDGGEVPNGLINSLNNSALNALVECLNYGEGFIYVDGDSFKAISRSNIITAHCDCDDLSDCTEAIILTTKQMDKELESESKLAKEFNLDDTKEFAADKKTAIKVYHYKLKNENLTIRTFINDELESESTYASKYLPIARAVCDHVLDGNKIVNRGLYMGVKDLLDALSLDYSVIRSKVANNPDAFVFVDKAALNDKAIAEAYDFPYGRSSLPFIGTQPSLEGGEEKITPPQVFTVPFNIESLHTDIQLVKTDIQNILGFNYDAEENRGGETVEAALLRRDNSYNSRVAYIEPVAQAVMQIVKVYNILLNTNYNVVNKVFVKIERDEKLRKILAIIQSNQKGYEGLLAEFAGFNEDETAKIIEASGIAQTIANVQAIEQQNAQLTAQNEQLTNELMNYRLDTNKVVESNQIRAQVELAKIESNANIKVAELALKNKDIANKYEIEVAKLLQKAREEIGNVIVPTINPSQTGGI